MNDIINKSESQKESGSFKDTIRGYLTRRGMLVGRWADRGLKVAAILGILWTVLLGIVAKSELNLLVWFPEDEVVYPSSVTGERGLPLSFRGDTASVVRVIKGRIVNYGSAAIGKPETLWRLSIRAPGEGKIALLSQPIVSPPSVVWRVHEVGEGKALDIELGVFERRAMVELDLLVVNVQHRRQFPIEVTPSLPGLPRELIQGSPIDRLRNKVLWVAMLTVSLLSLGLYGKIELEQIRSRQGVSRKVMYAGVTLVAFLLLIIFGGFFGATGLAYVISLFL